MQPADCGDWRCAADTRLLAKDPSHGKMLGLTMTGNIDNSIEMQGNFSSPSARAHVEDDNIGYVRPPSPLPPPLST